MSFPDLATNDRTLSLPSGLAAASAGVGAWSRADWCASILALAAFITVAGASWMVGDAVVPWDSKNQFYPFFRFLGEALAQGEAPLWNPYHFGGHPSAADPQSLIFTPSMALLAWLAPHASMALFDMAILAHLLAGGVAVLGLFARRGWEPIGAVLAALILMLGGVASSRLQHTGMIISYSYFPLALLMLERALDRPTLLRGLGFAISAALMALGRDQVAFLQCGALLYALGLAIAQAPAPLAYIVRRAPMLGLAAAIGAAILAVPALLTMQFLAASNRPGISFGVAAAGSLAPVNLITMLAPNFFGSLDHNYDYWGPGHRLDVSMPGFGAPADIDWTDPAVNYLFIGVMPVVLLVWRGVIGRRLLAREMRYALGLLVFAALYAFGRYTPVFSAIFDFVPGVALYRRPADAAFLLNAGLALASGALLHRYITDGAPPYPAQPGRRAPIAVALFVIAPLGWLASSAGQIAAAEGRLSFALAQLGLEGLAAAAGIAALAFCARDRRLRVAAALFVVALTAGELIARNAASVLNAEPASRYAVLDRLDPEDQAGLEALRRDMRPALEAGAHPRVEVLGMMGPWQNASMMLGLEDTLGYNPLRIADYERAVGPGENSENPTLRHFPDTFRGYRCRLAKLLGLEYLVLDRPLDQLPKTFPRPTATEIFAGARIHVYKLGRAAPRAYFASHAIPVDTSEALDAFNIPQFNRATEALIDQNDVKALRAPLTSAGPAGDARVAIAAYHDNRVLLELDADHAGIVVLHDMYYPGWRVTVDGVRAPLLRANILFRGVEVGPGHHVVEFSFHPFSVENLAAAASTLIHRNDE